MGTLPRDTRGFQMQVFTPRAGATITSPYTPTTDEVVILGADVTITLDAKAVDYTAGSVIGFASGVEYTLSATTDVHKM